MNDLVLTKNDEVVMKLLHYFITEQGYHPVILHGVQNEIWLENLENDYKIVRIVSSYIHNDEQLEFDVLRTRQILKKIKKRTFSLHLPTLSFFVNLGDNVHIEKSPISSITCLDIKEMKDIKNYQFLETNYPNIATSTSFKEKGVELFLKITGEINQASEKESARSEEIFKEKKPVVTYALIFINVILFLAMYLFGKGSQNVETLLNFGAIHPGLIQSGEWYRLLTGTFLHIGIFHLLLNMYALYVIGPQLEGFYGRTKYLAIYLISAVAGSLMSMLFLGNAVSAGASGAIFGLMGALLYFGYHYRVYLGSVIRSQIIPLILLNLFLGFVMTGVDNAAHIGGLIGGVLISMALGIKYKSATSEKINGWIMTAIFFFFLIYMAFVGIK